jgi:F-type H+-transporting ATPase subunit beta
MSSGRIIQIIGAVIDVEFERNSVPKIYDALQVDGTETTLEVQQQLGDGVFVPSRWVLLKVLNVV